MKNAICILVCAVLALLLNIQAAQAAFPIGREAEHSASFKTQSRSFESFVNSAIEGYHYPAALVGDEDENGKILNIVSSGLGMAGLIALIVSAFIPEFIFAFGALAVVTGIAAIITGEKGMDRTPLRGLGTAGFVLGIINLSVVFLFLVATLLFLGWILFIN